MKDEIILWLNAIEKNEGVPPDEVIAFNFGLYEAESGYMMYLVGGFEYSEENDDWACIELLSSKNFYFELPVELQSRSWIFVLDHCASLFKELEAEGKLNKCFLSKAKAITTGFDDGDLIKIR